MKRLDMGLKLSIDPGTTREHPLGVCWWRDGVVLRAFSIPPKGKEFHDRCNHILAVLDQDVSYMVQQFAEPPTAVAIETFIKWAPPARQLAIRQLSFFSGRLYDRFTRAGITPKYIDKGSTPKSQARQLAIKYGVSTEDQDACDALLVGFLAGFGS